MKTDFGLLYFVSKDASSSSSGGVEVSNVGVMYWLFIILSIRCTSLLAQLAHVQAPQAIICNASHFQHYVNYKHCGDVHVHSPCSTDQRSLASQITLLAATCEEPCCCEHSRSYSRGMGQRLLDREHVCSGKNGNQKLSNELKKNSYRSFYP